MIVLPEWFLAICASVFNWIVIALMAGMALLQIRLTQRGWYDRLWNSIRFKSWFLPVALVIFAGMMWREGLVQPFTLVEYELMPGGSMFALIVLWMIMTHVFSFLCYGVLMFYLWRKFDSLVPALYVGWAAIGLIEFTFIPQHFLHLGIWMSPRWYAPFLGIVMPFVVERRWFSFSRKSIVPLILAVFTQYVLLIWYPYSLHIYDFEKGYYVMNQAVLPEPPIWTWVFTVLNVVLKWFYVAAFFFVGYKGSARAKELKDFEQRNAG